MFLGKSDKGAENKKKALIQAANACKFKPSVKHFAHLNPRHSLREAHEEKQSRPEAHPRMPGSLSRQEEARGARERRRSGQGASRADRQPDEEKRILPQFRPWPLGDRGRARRGFPNEYVGARRQNPQPRGENLPGPVWAKGFGFKSGGN